MKKEGKNTKSTPKNGNTAAQEYNADAQINEQEAQGKDPFEAAPYSEEDEQGEAQMNYEEARDQGNAENPLFDVQAEAAPTNLAPTEGAEEDRFAMLEKRFEEMKEFFMQGTSEEIEALKIEKMKAEAEAQTKAQELENLKREMEKKAAKPKTTEDILKRAQNAVTIGRRRDLLNEKRNQLEAMGFLEEQRAEHITLEDGSGKRFAISNQKLIERIKSMVLAEIDIAIADTEAQLLAI